MGTYSGYAEFCAGYALVLELGVGAMNDPEAELEVLEELRARGAAALAPLREPAARAYAHFVDGAHPYRRWLGLLERAPRPYTGCAPEPLWASEARSRGARIPLEPWRAAPPDDVPLSGAPSGPAGLHLYLARGDVPYPLREVLDVQLVACQFAPGGVAPAAAARPFVDAARDAAAGLNRHTAWGLLHAAHADPQAVDALAGTDDPGASVAVAAQAFLGAAPAPEACAQAAASPSAARLLAALTPDARWEALAPVLDAAIA